MYEEEDRFTRMLRQEAAREEFGGQARTEATNWAKEQKEKHELPNDNTAEYNCGYVKAMNDIINFLK
ncbi:MAG: hypothetical protein AAFZ63_25635 [Bacteroidota bacterium]